MSKIALLKEKINPEHLEHLKQHFKEKTNAGAIYRLIEYFSIQLKSEKEISENNRSEYYILNEKYENLKMYLKAKRTAENHIEKLLNN